MKLIFYAFGAAILLCSVSHAQNLIITSPQSATPGYLNTIIGPSAGAKLIAGPPAAGIENTFVGAAAGQNFTGGSGNTFVGQSAGGSSAGSANTYIGYQAGSVSTATNNSFFGYQAGTANTTGTLNLFMGYQAGAGNTTASGNTMIGSRAGASNIGGRYNTFVGVQAGLNNVNGSSNFIMGANAGLSNRSGSGNFFLGDNTGAGNTSGNFNVYLGANAGSGNGSNNIAVGFESGGGVGSGINNMFVGFRAGAGKADIMNATALGNNARVDISDALVLGNNVNVGIGTNAPTAKLEVVSSTSNTSGLKLANLTSLSPATVLNQTKFLTVDTSGNVVLGSTTSGGRVGADLWQRNGTYLQSIDESAVIIGQGISKTPADYNLFVSKGILTEKVKVAVKNASEWSDYVFAPSYKLIPLAEVAQFIQTNKHLPGVPSAAEVVEQGVDMAKMDAKLLEKIEELTLYSIQQQTTVEKQQQEIDELKRLVKQLLERK